MVRSLMLLALLTAVWGLNWPIIKIGVSQLPPLWFRAIGLVLGTMLVGAVVVMRGGSLRVPRGARSRIALLALPNIVVWYSLVTVAMTALPAGRAAILAYTMPVWAALIGVVVYRERPDARVVVGIVSAACGVVLMIAGDWVALRAHPVGVELILLAAASWAWGTHLFRRASLALDTMTVTFWMMLCGSVVLLAASAVAEGARWRVPHGVEWLPILFNAVAVITIGNAIWFGIARTLSPTMAGLSSMLIPVVGVFSGMALLGEVPSWRDWLALALVCVAVGAALLPKRATA